MLLYPAIDVLKTKAESKYALAVLAARRGRDVIEGKNLPTEISLKEKPLTIATKEIANDYITAREMTPEEIEAAKALNEEEQ